MSKAVLSEAKRILLSTAWTGASMARNAKGQDCAPQDPSAACFCLMGSMFKQFPPQDREDTWQVYVERYPDLADAIRALAKVISNRDSNSIPTVITYNDNLFSYCKPRIQPVPRAIVDILDKALETYD